MNAYELGTSNVFAGRAQYCDSKRYVDYLKSSSATRFMKDVLVAGPRLFLTLQVDRRWQRKSHHLEQDAHFPLAGAYLNRVSRRQMIIVSNCEPSCGDWRTTESWQGHLAARLIAYSMPQACHLARIPFLYVAFH